MSEESPGFTAAAVQAAPVFLDREATIDKACHLVDDAARNGARLIVFPETWVPCYPFWVFGVVPPPTQARLFVQLFKNSVEIPSPATDALCQAAARAGAFVAIGVNERDAEFRGSLYNTLLFIDDRGQIMGVHRKLMPTHSERTVWGWGDASGLHVFETPLGRLGGLICWEHQMTLVKYAMYAKAEQVHASVWPALTVQNQHIDFGCRQYAFEGGCFVVAACGYLSEGQVPDELGIKGKAILDANGGSGIITPRGEYLAGPLYGQEGILYADIDLDLILSAKYFLDPVGHYARPDVAQLLLHDEPRLPVVHRPRLSQRAELWARLASAIERIEEDEGADEDPELQAAIEALERWPGRLRAEKE